MSSLDPIARFESPLDCIPSVDGQMNASESFDPVYSTPSLLEFKTVDPLRKRKAADPAPSRLSPWLLPLAYPLGRHLLFPLYFSQVMVRGQEQLPRSGPVILAPTHRSRWDAFMVPYATGRHVTGRDLRFMVSADEVTGLQGWFIRRMGGFPVNTVRPAISSLRHGVELLERGEMLVIFPEGNIFREQHVHPLKPGLARLAIQAETTRSNLGIKIVPIGFRYSDPLVPWRCKAEVAIGTPLQVSDYCTGSPKQDAKSLTMALQAAMERALGEREKGKGKRETA